MRTLRENAVVEKLEKMRAMQLNSSNPVDLAEITCAADPSVISVN